MSLDISLVVEDLEDPDYSTDYPEDDEYREINDTYQVFEINITHNLGEMADEAGIYKCLWRPEEIGIRQAGQLIQPLSDGLSFLKQYKEKFEKYNPDNGWGSYDILVKAVYEYLKACKQYPFARIDVCR
jgi:hypothetical protein